MEKHPAGKRKGRKQMPFSSVLKELLSMKANDELEFFFQELLHNPLHSYKRFSSRSKARATRSSASLIDHISLLINPFHGPLYSPKTNNFGDFFRFPPSRLYTIASISLVICQIHIYNSWYLEKIKRRSQVLADRKPECPPGNIYTMDRKKKNERFGVYLLRKPKFKRKKKV